MLTLVGTGYNSDAQNGGTTGTGDDVPSTTVNVVSVVELSLHDAFKINEEIGIIDSAIRIPGVTYEILPVQMPATFHTETIKAANLTVVEKLNKLYRGYIKAGAGSHLNGLADVYYNEDRSRTRQWGLRARHFTSSGGIKKYAHSGFSDTKLMMQGYRFMWEHRLSGSFEWDRNVHHFYGLPAADTMAVKDSIRQRFHRFHIHADLSSFLQDDNKLNYSGGVDYYHFGTLENASEHHVILRGSAVKKLEHQDYFGGRISLDINTFRPVGLQALYSDTPTPVDPDYSGSAIFKINPFFKTEHKKYNLHFGGVIAGYIESVGDFFFYPDIEARYSLFDDILIPYAGLKGDLERNNFRTLADENPFVLANVELRPTRAPFHLYGGFRGTFSSRTTFNTRVALSRQKDFVLFVNDSLFTAGNQFNVVYDAQTDVLNITGEIAYQQNEKLRMHLRGDFFNYNLSDEEKAWHLPDYRFTLGIHYDLKDAIMVRSNIFVNGARYARVSSSAEGATENNSVYFLKLKPYVDANLSVEYRYTKRLSLFLDINNVAGQRIHRWHNYPTQRFTAMGGLTWSF